MCGAIFHVYTLYIYLQTYKCRKSGDVGMGEVSVSSSTGADEPTICLYVFVFCICIFRVFDKDKEKVRMWLYGRALGEL